MPKQYVVGIDIGGQTSKLGVVDARGDVLSQTVIRTDTFGRDADAYIAALAEAVKSCIMQASLTPEDIRGIGVGAPNGNYYTGEVEIDGRIYTYEGDSLEELREDFEDIIDSVIAFDDMDDEMEDED